MRFWKIRGDLPYVFHYDEPTLIDNAVWMLEHQTLNPHFFNYPTGLIYLLAAIFGLVLLGGRLFGVFEGGADSMAWFTSGTYTRPPEGGVLYFYPTIGVPLLYMIGRVISACAGIASIALVYAIARRVEGGRGAARLAGLFMAISPLAVHHAHLITTDTSAMAMATLAFLAVMRAEENGTRGWTVAGALGGLAAGIKYNAGLVFLTLPLLAVWRLRSGAARLLRLLVLSAIAAILVFIVTTPFALLDSETFMRDFRYELDRVATIAVPFEGAEAVEATSAEKIGEVLWHNLGIFGILMALWGVICAFRKRNFASVAIVFWLVLALIPQLLSQRLYARYLLLAWPPTLLLAAFGVIDVAGRIARVLPGEQIANRYAMVVVASIVLVIPTARLARQEMHRATPDPRIEMTEWIAANISEGERLVMEPGGPFPGRDRYTTERVDFLGRLTPEEYRARGLRYLIGTGRERRVEGEPAFDFVFENLQSIRDASTCVWESGKYKIYYLGGGPAWEDPVNQAMAAGDMAGARAILEQEVLAGGASAHAWKKLGSIRVAAGDTLAGIDALANAMERDTSDVEIPLTLSNLHLELGDFDSALEQLEQAESLAPRDPLIFHNKAVVYLYRARSRFKAGDLVDARTDWIAAGDHAAMASKIAPGDPDMTEIAGQVERMGRRWGFVQR